MVVEITRFMMDHKDDPEFVEEAIARIIQALPPEHANRDFAIAFLHIIRNEDIALKEGYSVNLLLHIVTKNGVMIDLTPYEVRIFEVLAESPDHMLTFEEISDKVWHYKQDVCNIRVNVNNIRKKIGKYIITSVKGKGYKLNV